MEATTPRSGSAGERGRTCPTPPCRSFHTSRFGERHTRRHSGGGRTRVPAASLQSRRLCRRLAYALRRGCRRSRRRRPFETRSTDSMAGQAARSSRKRHRVRCASSPCIRAETLGPEAGSFRCAYPANDANCRPFSAPRSKNTVSVRRRPPFRVGRAAAKAAHPTRIQVSIPPAECSGMWQ